ncbi:OmpA family protein [Nocardiopsis sp. RSe5-2]|uniref:OmpA family protein n=1 Tax=Nocardiopsis endophytica TaxID=3018445 RepID=A0ABT4U0N5_9ACTN|nr:OmpA family protein [Nocardiopsis endophytica]MDA2810508.1 OmpA family protein [Nocardiopsis endophytica]
MARKVKRARALPWLASVGAVLLGLSGCSLLGGDGGGGGGGEDPGKDGGGGAGSVEPITSRATNVWEMPGGRAEISLHRVDDEHMIARMKVVNEEDTRIHMGSHLAEGFGESEDYPWDYFSGVAWLDPGGRKLHRPYYVDDEGQCLCSPSSGSVLDEGEEWEGYAVLAAPPADVEALTVVTHVALPFVDVPVEDGAPEGLDYTPPSEEPDAEPETVELESVLESDQETVIEDSEATDFNLSTDVLFEVEESELTSEADELLDTTAADIEELGPTQVRIEGHADSSGNDEINDPLSQDRAEAVRDALEERIGGDIEYETEGFGSREPIASNETEDGRERNRRVTISVPKGTPVEDGSKEDGAGGGASPDEDGAADQGEGTPAAEAAVSGPADDDEDAPEVDVALTGLQAVTPNTALLTYELHNPNDDDASVDLYMSSEDWMEFRYHATHAVALESPGGGRAARPLRVDVPDDREDPYCFCSSAAGINLGSTILPPGGTAEYYAMLPITAKAAVTDVTVGTMGTMEGVAITR